MNTTETIEHDGRELDVEQRQQVTAEPEKTVGLLAGLIQGISDAFTRHKERLAERVLELQQKQQMDNPGEAALAEASEKAAPSAPEQSKELVHIGMGEGAFRDNPEVLRQQEEARLLGNLQAPATPHVAQSRSAAVGHSLSA